MLGARAYVDIFYVSKTYIMYTLVLNVGMIKI